MKTLFFVYLTLALVVLSSCQKSGSDAYVPGVNGQCATNAASCNTGAYNQARGTGYYPYGYNSSYGYNYNYNSYAQQPFTYYNNSAYLCHCPPGTIPTYNSYAGIGCVNANHWQYNSSAYFYLGWGANSWNFTGSLNTYNYGNYSNSNCYNGAIQSCVINQANSCPSGSFCHARMPGSLFGLCTFGSR